MLVGYVFRFAQAGKRQNLLQALLLWLWACLGHRYGFCMEHAHAHQKSESRWQSLAEVLCQSVAPKIRAKVLYKKLAHKFVGVCLEGGQQNLQTRSLIVGKQHCTRSSDHWAYFAQATLMRGDRGHESVMPVPIQWWLHHVAMMVAMGGMCTGMVLVLVQQEEWQSIFRSQSKALQDQSSAQGILTSMSFSLELDKWHVPSDTKIAHYEQFSWNDCFGKNYEFHT